MGNRKKKWADDNPEQSSLDRRIIITKHALERLWERYGIADLNEIKKKVVGVITKGVVMKKKDKTRKKPNTDYFIKHGDLGLLLKENGKRSPTRLLNLVTVVENPPPNFKAAKLDFIVKSVKLGIDKLEPFRPPRPPEREP